ncbi:MAG: hypothetical protein IT281_10160, partial [Ignavibacteria bacterium]|nr:hypothetical protein [Ignavibacteria bacterium]
EQSKKAKADKAFAALQRESGEWSPEERYALYEEPLVREHYRKEWLSLAAVVGPDHESASDYLSAWIAKGEASKIAAHFKGAGASTQAELGAQVLEALVALKKPALAQGVLKQWVASNSEDREQRFALFFLAKDAVFKDTRRALLSEWVKEVQASDGEVDPEVLLEAARAGLIAEVVPLMERWCPSEGAPERESDVGVALQVLGEVSDEQAGEVKGLRARCAAHIMPVFQAERRERRADPDWIVSYAQALRGLGERASAARVLSELVEFDPHGYQNRINYGAAFLAQEKPLEACAQYAVAVQTNPAQRDTFREMMGLRRAFPAQAEAIKGCIADGVSSLPVRRDLSVLLTWEDPEADIDLHITEAGGEHVFYSENESESGGLLYYDITDGFGPEIYVLGSTEGGDYTFDVHYYGGPGTPISGTLTVMTKAVAPNEERKVFPF